jgi:hypothetical protein
MAIPKKLRFMVYDYFIIPRIRPITMGGYGLAYNDPVPDPAITALSHEIRDEVREATDPKRQNEPVVVYIMNHNVDMNAIREILIMARGLDLHELRKKTVDSDQGAPAIAPPVAKWALAAPNRKLSVALGHLNARFDWRKKKIDIDKSKPLVETFLASAMLRLRQTPRMEYRYLILPRKSIIDTMSFKASIFGEIVHRESLTTAHIQEKVTLVFEDAESKDSVSNRGSCGILFSDSEVVPMRLATPEELVYMSVNAVKAAVDHN